MSRRQSRSREDEEDGYASEEAAPIFDGLVKGRPNYPPGDGYVVGEQPLPTPKAAKSKKGADEDGYESDWRNSTARDGYERDRTSDAYEERGYGYGDRGVRRDSYSRGYGQRAVGYSTNDRRYRSQQDLNENSYYDRRPEKRSRSRGQKEEKSKNEGAGGGKEGGKEHHDGAGNDDIKKWAATLAGAAAGGFAGHKAQRDNWVGPTVGAIIGGIIAREVEKDYFRRKERTEVLKGAPPMRSRSR